MIEDCICKLCDALQSSEVAILITSSVLRVLTLPFTQVLMGSTLFSGQDLSCL